MSNDLTADSQLAGGATLQVPARVRDTLPGKLLLIPLPSRPFFPAQTMPIVLPEDPWRETVERVGNTPQRLVGLVHATGNMHELPSPENFRRIGTVVRMHQMAISSLSRRACNASGFSIGHPTRHLSLRRWTTPSRRRKTLRSCAPTASR